MGIRSAQERAIQAQQDFAWWEVNDEQRHEKAHVELVIPKGAVCLPFLGLWGTHAGQVSTQVVMINAPRGHHRQEHVDQALKGVDSEATGVPFEVLSEQ